jgi:sec-independent protein translocase protein TatB
MFDIGWSEILIIAVVAVVVIGPKELPRALRAVGYWVGKARRMAGDFQRQFNEAIREAELDDVKKQVSDLGKIDPIGDIRKEMNKTGESIRTDLENVTKIDKPKDGAAKPEPATADAAPAAESVAPAPVAAEPAASTPVASASATPPPAVATGDAKP